MPDVPDLSAMSLAEIAEAAAAHRLPPVDSWHPEASGESAMRIAADGRWFHEGGEIRRPNMVRLFASILRREADGGHVLVTPAEKLSIIVEDAAFQAVEVKSEGKGDARRLAFRLNTGDLIVAGPTHALVARGNPETPRLYLHVRGGLEARIARPVWYELAEWAITAGGDPPSLWSEGARFALTAA